MQSPFGNKASREDSILLVSVRLHIHIRVPTKPTTCMQSPIISKGGNRKVIKNKKTQNGFDSSNPHPAQLHTSLKGSWRGVKHQLKPYPIILWQWLDKAICSIQLYLVHLLLLSHKISILWIFHFILLSTFAVKCQLLHDKLIILWCTFLSKCIESWQIFFNIDKLHPIFANNLSFIIATLTITWTCLSFLISSF